MQKVYIRPQNDLIIVTTYIELYISDAGFTEEWSTTSDERTRQRQVEIQANVSGNPNRPMEYRTVTATATHQQPNPEPEAEERMCFANKLIM